MTNYSQVISTNGTSTGTPARRSEKSFSAPTRHATSPGVLYENIRPLIVWLGVTELAWISYWLLSSGDASPGHTVAVGVWIVVMLVWMALVIYAGTRNFFLDHTRWLSNLIGVAVVLAFAGVLFGTVSVAREGFFRAAFSTSDVQLISIHILRLLAIGTVVKYAQRQLPLHFILFGSIPDFLFAVSAVVLTFLASQGTLGSDFLVVWHSVGFALFLGAGISMFFSVPSPFRIFHSKPDASIVFQFPMVLAPNFTVPLFMLAHVFALAKLLSN